MSETNIHLTAGEIGSLWSAYMSESMSMHVLEFMLQHIQDPDIKSVIQTSYDKSVRQVEQLLNIFDTENYAIPNGFTEQDVTLEAPWLFTDLFSLSYVNNMAKIGMVTYSGAVSMCDRTDIRNLFTQALTGASQTYNLSKDLILSKGTGGRHPYIKVPEKSDYIKGKDYLSGLKPFSDKRPLNAIEITHLFANVKTNTIGSKLSLAFAQTSPSKEVQEFMLRSKEISQKHVQIFSDTLMEDDIETPQVPDVSISESKTHTFSDKLIMFHMDIISASGIGNYATAGAASQRSDLMLNYERLSLEAARLSKSGADIMIENNWLEQPPGVKDREKLAKNKSQD